MVVDCLRAGPRSQDLHRSSLMRDETSTPRHSIETAWVRAFAGMTLQA